MCGVGACVRACGWVRGPGAGVRQYITVAVVNRTYIPVPVCSSIYRPFVGTQRTRAPRTGDNFRRHRPGFARKAVSNFCEFLRIVSKSVSLAALFQVCYSMGNLYLSNSPDHFLESVESCRIVSNGRTVNIHI